MKWRATIGGAVFLAAAGLTPGLARQRAEPPRDWQLLDDSLDHVPGISAERAWKELLAGMTPARTVVVALIDTGADTAHAALHDVLWTNPKEVAGNGRDDDQNGYVDDIHGWNYLGSRDGRSYDADLSEEERVMRDCRREAARGKGDQRSASDRILCDRLLGAREAQRDTLNRLIGWLQATQDTMVRYGKILRSAAGTDSLSKERVLALSSLRPEVTAAQRWWLHLPVQDIPEQLIAKDLQALDGERRALDGIPDPRPLVGDLYERYDERGYGNPDVRGPEPSHGTHVAGLVAALPDSGVRGVARAAVRLMILRAVPTGDERDKDVANAIRYAVDNGARIINMSFGKHLSPGKSVVDDAVAYADRKGVLMVHAAGNDGLPIGPTVQPFPSPRYLKGGTASVWIEVGASSWHPGDGLAAIFSNYGAERVDVFAPGEDLVSALPGGGYIRESGTSMSAPVVSGIAAVLMAYYPALTAADVKRIILASAVRYSARQVIRPGESDSLVRVPFGSLSRTGGVANLYRAVQLVQHELKKP